MGSNLLDITTKKPNEIANQIVEDLEQPNLLPGDDSLPVEELSRRISAIENSMKDKVDQLTIMFKHDQDQLMIPIN